MYSIIFSCSFLVSLKVEMLITMPMSDGTFGALFDKMQALACT